MRQKSRAEDGFERFGRATHCERFLVEMNEVTGWRDLCKSIKPFSAVPKVAGRPSVGLERMLCIHFLHHWFNLSDSAV